jgi:trehalose 6-phosphate synthase/phosphatase
MASPVRTIVGVGPNVERDRGDRRLCLTPPSASGSGRVMIVSNRLPYSFVEGNGGVEIRESNGGLASALGRVHTRTRGIWIGGVESSGGPGLGPRLRGTLERERLAIVPLTPLEMADFYRRFSNGVLWPALHGIDAPDESDRCGWDTYRAVNQKFADAVAERWRCGDVIWVHDYHLMLVPQLLRDRIPSARIAFFLHTPLPAPSRLAALPKWPELAAGLLGADVLAFQTGLDACHFADYDGSRNPDRLPATVIRRRGRPVRVIACPVGVDVSLFDAQSKCAGVVAKSAALRATCDGPLFAGVDRLDYTKGIPERLLAFERLLVAHPELIGRARLIQVTVPSRENVQGYQVLKARIDSLVERINAAYCVGAWTPIEHVYKSVDVETLVALYTAADVMVVTPRRDGMNLVAKEFVAARSDGGGVLVLSGTAGAARELRAAVLVDPTSVESIANGLRRAMLLSPLERQSRMRRLRAAVSARDVFAWADRCLAELEVATVSAAKV